MKILVVAPSWIGDTVLAQPLFTLLHAKHDALELDVLAPAWTVPVVLRMREVRRGPRSSLWSRAGSRDCSLPE